MRSPSRPLLLAALAATLVPSAALTQVADSGVIFDNRIRYEAVEQDGLEDAHALTVRTRLGWKSPVRSNFQVLVEGEAVGALVDDYNDTIHGPPGQAVVADPETIELNRAQVTWTGLPDTEVTIGRQRLILDNARFVGNVGFRQNEQTFDAVTVRTTALKPATLTWVYVDHVHRIFGDDSPMGDWRSDSHLVNLALPTPVGRLTGYGYLLDLDDAPALSSATWGARLAGSRPLSPDLSANWTVEYARQTEHGDNPFDFAVDYVLASAGLTRGPLSGAVAFERLGDDGGRAFQTPLATLHAFQGWADVFLTTPPNGLRDLSATLSYAVASPPVGRSMALTAAWRDFADADGSTRYGSELDLSARAVLNARWAAELKTAWFDGAQPAFADRTKVWLSLEYNF